MTRNSRWPFAVLLKSDACSPFEAVYKHQQRTLELEGYNRHADCETHFC
jgi:hypothetical protein